MRDGIAWVLDYAAEHGAPVTLCGHSAGSHLTAMALSSPTMQSRRSPLRAVYHMAGVYDLKPLVGTEITKPLNLKMEEAIANSPMSEANLDEYCKTMVDATTRIVYGHQECPGLRSQNEDLAKVGHFSGLSKKMIFSQRMRDSLANRSSAEITQPNRTNFFVGLD